MYGKMTEQPEIEQLQEQETNFENLTEPGHSSSSNILPSENPLKKSLKYTGISLLGLAVPVSRFAPFVSGAYKGVMDLQGLATPASSYAPAVILGSSVFRAFDNIAEEESPKIVKTIASSTLEFMVGWGLAYGLGSLGKRAFY